MFSLAKLIKPALGLLAGVTMMAAATSLAAADETHVVFVTHGQSGDPYWSVVKNGMDDAAKTLGVKAEYLAPETFDMAKMAQMIDAITASKPDGMVVSIPDAAALSGPVKNAVAAGIPVIVIDSGGSKLTHDLGGLLFMGQDEFQAGVMAGERIKALGLTKAVCANHEVGNSSLDDRCAGFAKGLGVDVPVMNGVIDPTEMKNRMIAYMTAHADTQFILAVGASGAEPTLAALDEMGLAGKVKTGTFDLSPTILQAVVAGKMEWGIDAQQYAMGYIPVAMFDLWKKYKIMPIADYPTGPGFVTKDTAASVIDLAKQGKR
ncbi:sugar ABC transporter substrate-binding protein [Mesorhizobium sophorae]|uniref:rhizopine catabolism ABC transporter substrate-binding protein n=1 Tax=Mesorhizobium sophorae TaxID=1300294 RepID=UPI000BA41F16|nr:sugar ABC transporter substrate-binding protein [Mesorhizobium sophorae]